MRWSPFCVIAGALVISEHGRGSLRNCAARKPRGNEFKSKFLLKNLASLFGIFARVCYGLTLEGIFVNVFELGPQKLHLGPGIHGAGGDLQLPLILNRDLHEVIDAIAFCFLAEEAEFGRGGKSGSLDTVGWNTLLLEKIHKQGIPAD